MSLHDGDRGRGVETAVDGAVGDDEQVRGEPVAADVGALPGLVRPAGRERQGDGSAPHGTADVVPAVRAHQEQRRSAPAWPGRPAESGAGP